MTQPRTANAKSALTFVQKLRTSPRGVAQRASQRWLALLSGGVGGSRQPVRATRRSLRAHSRHCEGVALPR